MRKAVTGAALTVGALCVCLALALAALALFGGASAKTAAPPAAGPRAADEAQPVSAAVESSSELASSEESAQIGSESVSGSSVLAGSGSEKRTSGGGPVRTESAPAEAVPAEEAHSEEQAPEGPSSQDEMQKEATEDVPGPDGASSGRSSTAASTATENSDPEGSEAQNPGTTSSTPGRVLGSAGTVAKSPAPARPEIPEDKTMRLSVPAMARVQGAEVRNAAHDDRAALDAGALHPKGTGFPWERQVNVYIAGHRVGYPGTGSFLLFRDLNTLTPGDSVFLTDAMGREYRYEVFEKEVVDPDETSVMDEREGSNIVTLQTCTLPDYTQRLLVRAVKVEGP